MSKERNLFLVVGAPGSGKTSALNELLNEKNEFVALDIDWIMESASTLAGKDVVFAEDTWKPFRHIWGNIINGLYRNNRTVLLFANMDKDDLSQLELDSSIKITWLLLDCSDKVRTERQESRYGKGVDVSSDLKDATKLRAQVENIINTDEISPAEVAAKIKEWVENE